MIIMLWIYFLENKKYDKRKISCVCLGLFNCVIVFINFLWSFGVYWRCVLMCFVVDEKVVGGIGLFFEVVFIVS